ncbi:MAG: hypothetical protein ACLGIB_08830 [Actinomycetota bacterium]
MGRARSLAVAALLVTALVGTPARAGVGRNGLIAFSRQGDVFTIRPGGTGLEQLTSGDAEDVPLWTRDGSMLVVVRALHTETGSRWRVLTMRPDGSDRMRFRPRVLGSIQRPDVSPDGTKLVYADMDLSNTGLPDPYASAIRILDLRTGARSRLTGYGTWNSGPAWSPDGTKIAFESSRDGDAEIYVMAPDGTGLVQVTRNEVNDFSPVWSPDGTRIAFQTTFPNVDGGDDGSAIAMVDVGGGEITVLTDGSRFDGQPVWSPDGSLILFSSSPTSPEGGRSHLWVMGPDGSEQTVIADEGDFAAWSPDGTKVVFARGGDLFIVAVAGDNEQRLTRGAAFDYWPAWQER